MLPSSEECAHDVLEVVPLVMRSIRAEVRRQRSHDLSVAQFRSLGFINRNPGTQLSSVAKHLGLTPPSTSKLIDGLVERHLVERQPSTTDRRCITLHLTGSGKALLEASYQASKATLSIRLAGLAENDRADIIRALRLLRQVFSDAS